MSKDASHGLHTLLLRLLLGLIILVGMALTWGAAGVGLAMAFRPVYRCPSKVSRAIRQVKAARDAVTQYMIETPSCPHGIDELVAGKYLERSAAKDPWGSQLVLTCPGMNDADGADVASAGPDRELGTTDDIKSWELATANPAP
jgi:hypothetical protein